MSSTTPAAAPRPTGEGRRRAHRRVAQTASAQVIEIGPDGGAVTYTRPTVFTSDGSIPIVQARAAPTGGASSADIQRFISEAAIRQHLSSDLVGQVAWRESHFRQTAVSNRDAVGVMQLTAGTARALGVDRYDLSQNIHGGAAYLRGMLDRYRGDLPMALAAYNAGPSAVDRYHGIPPYRETQDYVTAILARLPARTLVSVNPISFTR
jgi:soluble lytic murein transglycosylase-like protein